MRNKNKSFIDQHQQQRSSSTSDSQKNSSSPIEEETRKVIIDIKSNTQVTSGRNKESSPYDIIRPKWSTNLLNNIRLLSPRTWIGISRFISLMNDETSDEYNNDIPNILTSVLNSWLMNIIVPLLVTVIILPHLPGNYDGMNQSMLPTSFLYTLPNSSGSNVISRNLHSMSRTTSPLLPTMDKTNVVSNVRSMILMTLLSPLSLSTIHQTLPPIRRVSSNLKYWRQFRIEADEDAVSCLAHRISHGSAIRTRHFDAYFPTPKNTQPPNKMERRSKRKGILFLPGALVDHTSYASIASKLAEEGNMVVAVLSLEPLRMAASNLGADLENLTRVMRRVDRMSQQRDNISLEEQKKEDSGIDWFAIGGHSLGGYAAMRLAPLFARHVCHLRNSASTTERDTTDGPGTNAIKTAVKLVVWGAGNKPKLVPNLANLDLESAEKNTNGITIPSSSSSSVVSPPSINVLVLQAGNDVICSFPDQADKEMLMRKLPPIPITTFKSIPGGTHNNFSSYPGNAMFDGVADISREEQHHLVCSETLNFLLDGDISDDGSDSGDPL